MNGGQKKKKKKTGAGIRATGGNEIPAGGKRISPTAGWFWSHSTARVITSKPILRRMNELSFGFFFVLFCRLPN